MPTKRIDVFISSTTKDLSAHREAVHTAIGEAGMYSYRMEDGAATGKDPLTFSLDLIDQAEVYVGIFGLRYGYIPVDPVRNPDKRSITELEYRYAVKKNLPMCIFFIDKYEIGPDQLDEDPTKLIQMKALRAELQEKYFVKFCTSVDDLHHEVYKALTELVRKGIVTLDDEPPAATHRGKEKFFSPPDAMRNRLFISYRRDDSVDIAGRIYDYLTEPIGPFPTSDVFKDVDSIPLGTNFKAYLERVVSQCAVCLVVIGPRWLDVTDQAGNRRLDDPADFVRIEIEMALRRDIPVIPLLVSGATVPAAAQLPPTLAELSLRNGTPIGHDPYFKPDVARLIRALEKILAQNDAK